MRTRFPTPMVESFSANLQPSSSFEKLLDKVTFRICLNINDGTSLQIYVECLEIIELVVVVLMVFFTCGKLVLVIWVVFPILRNEYGI